MKKPFPGMNPYLEEQWDGVHARLIVYIADQIQEKLPTDLVARTEELLPFQEEGQQGRLRPDVKVVEPAKLREPVGAYAAAPPGEAPPIAEPLLVLLEPEQERWIEIREMGGRLITVIELLSPTNKSGQGQANYRRRQRLHLSGGVNLVEIDLLRKGEHVLAVPPADIPSREQYPYMICVARAIAPDTREVYPVPLRVRLPAFRVPLRATDKDVLLDLQPLVDQSFERGGYWSLDYRAELEPPLPPADAAWVDEVLHKSGLR